MMEDPENQHEADTSIENSLGDATRDHPLPE
jgi:hypothetical protein